MRGGDEQEVEAAHCTVAAGGEELQQRQNGAEEQRGSGKEKRGKKRLRVLM
jgi:hypothetical protein